MTTLTPQKPNITNPVTPTFTQCTTNDKFAAAGGTYVIHYKNGASATTECYVVNQNTSVPKGAATPTKDDSQVNWSDALISSAVGANSERVIAVDAVDIADFIDATGFVNLHHTGTLTTLTVAVYGPF